MAGLIDGVGRVFMLATGVLLLAGLGAHAGDGSASNGQMTAVRAHCTHFAKNNKRIGAAPEVFCGCLVNAVRGAFDASGQKIVFTAMAATAANDKGEWHWMTSRKFVDTARAQHYTDKQKHAFSGHLQTILRTEMPRCAIAERAPAGPVDATAVPRAAKSADACKDKTCFADRFAGCRPAVYTTAGAMGGRVRYEVRGADGPRCRVRLWFTVNPNAAWVNKTLTLTLDPDRAFEPQIKKAMRVCLTKDDAGDFDCSGPLRGIAAGASK